MTCRERQFYIGSHTKTGRELSGMELEQGLEFELNDCRWNYIYIYSESEILNN